MGYSAFLHPEERIFQENRNWQPVWRTPEPKPHYDVIIVGGGGHGLATAYYLAKEFGITNIAVLEKSYNRLGQCRAKHHDHPLELHAAGQRSRFYELSMKLWEGLEQDFKLQCDGVAARYRQPHTLRRTT